MERDLPLYEGTDIVVVDAPEEAELAVIRGPPRRHARERRGLPGRSSPASSRSALRLACANPDIGGGARRRAPSLRGRARPSRRGARSGTVLQFGKPHAPIYEKALGEVRKGARRRQDVPSWVGDGPLPTDITGANRHGFDALFITDGIHAEEVGVRGAPRSPCAVRGPSLEARALMGPARRGRGSCGERQWALIRAAESAVASPGLRGGPCPRRLPERLGGEAPSAIGNFDRPIHRGPPGVFLVRPALRRAGARSWRLTFDPHPRNLLSGERTVFSAHPRGARSKAAIGMRAGWGSTLAADGGRPAFDEAPLSLMGGRPLLPRR